MSIPIDPHASPPSGKCSIVVTVSAVAGRRTREAVGMGQRLADGDIRMLKMNPTPAMHQEMVKALLQSLTNGTVELYTHAGLLRDDLLSLSLVKKAYGLRLEADRTDAGHADLGISFVMAFTLSRMWLVQALEESAAPQVRLERAVL